MKGKAALVLFLWEDSYLLEELENMVFTLCPCVSSAFACFTPSVIKHFEEMTNRNVVLLKQRISFKISGQQNNTNFISIFTGL